ncbi:MAG: hypothetical protein QM754_07475 [Tepidisphaeraceae bacterium]
MQTIFALPGGLLDELCLLLPVDGRVFHARHLRDADFDDAVALLLLSHCGE